MTVLRPVTAEELPDFLVRASTTFTNAAVPADVLAARVEVAATQGNLGAFDGGDLVATAGVEALALTVPGGAVPAAGIGRVTVLPTHRRRGIMTAMLRRIVDEARERGDVAAILFASEAGIYGRFGFGAATNEAGIRVACRRGAFLAAADVAGLRLVPWAEAVPKMRQVAERVCAARPGAIRRADAWWRFVATSPPPRGVPWEAVMRAQGDGFVACERRVAFDLPAREGGTLRVHWLFADTPEAYAALWRYCLDMDLMDEVRAAGRSADEPLRHLLADPAAQETEVWDGLWLRLLDVEAGLSARTYAPGPPLRLAVTDAFCPWNGGTYEVGESGCRRVAAEPDLALAADALGACYLGGNRFTTLAAAGRVEERTPGAAARADLLFAAASTPWCPFHF